jgi:CubicO group peptidase (beta-lactamase class C family)
LINPALIAATVTLSCISPAPVIANLASATAATSKFQLNSARIDRMLEQMVARERVAGASVLIWKDGREAYFRSVGWADRETKKPMRRDTLMQVWSMTKPITGVGLMRLWEQGRFGIDEPLAKYLPEYSNVKVFAGTDAAGNPLLKPLDRPILVRDILRHTAGFAYWDGPTYPEKMLGKVDPLNIHNTLTEFSQKMATIPLMYQPGTQWRYSAAVDVQARLIEVLSGMKFEDYESAQVLEPLGMHDSAWTQPHARLSRLAIAYESTPEGTLRRKKNKDIQRMNFSDRRLTMGGAGLATTLDDYMRFARMLLNRGSLDGVRILKPSTIKLMSTDQLDPKIRERLWLPGKGNGGFGFDFFVRTGQPKNRAESRGSTGEFFWDGAWSTLFWVDPTNDMAVVFLVQKDPFDGTLHHDIREAVYGPSYLGPKGD